MSAWITGTDLALAGFVGLGIGVGLVIGTAVWRTLWPRGITRPPGGDDDFPGRGRHL